MKKEKKEAAPTAEKKEKSLSFFDYLNSINQGVRGPYMFEGITADTSELNDQPSHSYVPFMVNRGLSFFPDTVLFANEMNKFAFLPEKMQFDFYRNIVRPRKRYSKWFKGLDDSDKVKTIAEYYGMSIREARSHQKLITDEQINIMKSKLSKGGRAGGRAKQ